MSEACGNKIGIRYPSAPSDEWDTATCIQAHEGSSPGAERVVHNSGDGWKWMLLDGFVEEAALIVPASELKMLRETLCWAQTAAGPGRQHVVAHLETLIAAIDEHRPLGADGKHGDLHTPTCGCEQ